MLAPYPQYCDKLSFPKEAKEMALVFETITSLRNVRQSFNIPMSLNFDIQIQAPHDEKAIFEEIESYVKRMARVNTISYIDENSAPSKSATAIVSASKIYIPLKGLIDFDQEIQRQNKKLNKLLTEKKSLQGRINNPKFVSSAPKELVDQTKGRIEEIEVQENAINSLIKSLQD